MQAWSSDDYLQMCSKPILCKAENGFAAGPFPRRANRFNSGKSDSVVIIIIYHYNHHHHHHCHDYHHHNYPIIGHVIVLRPVSCQVSMIQNYLYVFSSFQSGGTTVMLQISQQQKNDDALT